LAFILSILLDSELAVEQLQQYWDAGAAPKSIVMQIYKTYSGSDLSVDFQVGPGFSPDV
jgi:hypothetical protein